ncbi:MAG: hypothetical protein KBF36_11575 [Chitinophagaceae bacterium]|jgi:hypothetical protein|nr:hypothetical protein [Chitinophagaceae bacterium]
MKHDNVMKLLKFAKNSQQFTSIENDIYFHFMKLTFLLASILCCNFAFSADSLYVTINKKSFEKKDTISIDCLYKYTSKEHSALTLNVWIEDIQKTRIWKFRYPLLNGNASFDLVIDSTLPDGRYAINFLVQPTFFSIKGKVRDYNKKSKGLTFFMLSKRKETYINTIQPNIDGAFTIGKMAFPDTARFIFSETGKSKKDIFIDLETPIDSAFTPLVSYTQIVDVGHPKLIAADTIKPYSLDGKRFTGKFTLQEVVVKSSKKKAIEKFDDEYATGLFKGGKVFDGIDDVELLSAVDVFQFLRGKIPSMQINPNEEGGYDITRRNSKVDVYIDEFRLSPTDPIFVNPADIAMIKVFDPLDGPGTSGGGSIAIYTKRGSYAQNSNRKNNFPIRGYNDVETVWK